MKRLILLMSCLILAGGHTFSLAAYANFYNVQFSDNTPITNAASATAPVSECKDNATIITIPPPMLRCTVKTEINTSSIAADTNIRDKSENGFIATSNCFNLDKGNILVSPDRDISINTYEGTVSIASGATIFVMASTQGIVVYDLNQTKPKQVSIVVNKHKLVMEPGLMLVLTRQKTKNFEELEANCHGVSYHRPEKIELQGGNMTAFAAGFSISSALVRIIPLKQLVNSSERRDQLLLDKLIKSAVILGV